MGRRRNYKKDSYMIPKRMFTSRPNQAEIFCIDDLDKEQILEMYEKEPTVTNAINFWASDLLNSDIEILEGDELSKHHDIIMTRLNELKWFDKVKEQIVLERLTGTGGLYIALELAGSEEIDLSQPLDRKIVRVAYLNPFSKWDMNDVRIEKSIFSSNYKKITSFEIDNNKIHSDYATLISSNATNENVLGISIVEKMYKAIWSSKQVVKSIGKIAYNMMFREFKLSGMNLQNKNEYETKVDYLRDQAETNNLVVVGKEDSVQFRSPGGLPNLDQFDQVLWNQITTATQIPKSIITGKQEGITTGGEYDIVNYYSRLMGYWEAIIEPSLRKIIDYILLEQGMSIEYIIKKKHIYQMTEKEEAELEKLVAETEAIKVNTEINKINNNLSTVSDSFGKLSDDKMDSLKELMKYEEE